MALQRPWECFKSDYYKSNCKASCYMYGLFYGEWPWHFYCNSKLPQLSNLCFGNTEKYSARLEKLLVIHVNLNIYKNQQCKQSPFQVRTPLVPHLKMGLNQKSVTPRLYPPSTTSLFSVRTIRATVEWLVLITQVIATHMEPSVMVYLTALMVLMKTLVFVARSACSRANLLFVDHYFHWPLIWRLNSPKQ